MGTNLRSDLCVLHVCASVSPSDGGSSTAVIETTRALRERSIEACILTTDADGAVSRLSVPTGSWTKREGVPVRYERRVRPGRLKPSWRLAVDMWRMVKCYDVVHVHGYYLFHDVAAWAICRARGVPYVLQPHGSFEPYHHRNSRTVKRIWDGTVGRAITKGAAAVIFTSESERDACTVPLSAPSTVVALGADHVKTPDIPKGDDPEACRVLFLGRLTKKKRPDLLVRTWPEVLKRIPHARLIIAGPDGDLTKENLNAIASRLGCGSSVSLLGPVGAAERSALLQASDVFILPSLNENFSLSAGEALSAGLPSLLPAEVAIAPLAAAEGACILLSGLEFRLAEEITSLLLDGDRRKLLSIRARDFVSTNLSWSASARQLEATYREILGERFTN